MRREPTDAERKLWYLLRDRRFVGVKFRRQAPLGRYIVDFVCFQHKLVVEADGGQHYEDNADASRDSWLAQEGLRRRSLFQPRHFEEFERRARRPCREASPSPGSQLTLLATLSPEGERVYTSTTT
jgi:Protein of unknown function (DUF559)